MAAPVPTILDIDRTVISAVAGVSRCTVTFKFDQRVDVWELRANGNGPGQGSLVERDSGARVGSAKVGSAKVCGVAANTVQTAYIDWDEGLIEGDNTIDIYGRNAADEWTAHS